MAAVGVGQTIAVVACIVLTICGVALSIAGMLSPAWQVVNILEFRAEHQHGLWLDCTRAERHLVSADRFDGDYEERPLHCTYKFDYSAAEVIGDTLRNIDENSAAGEAEHHQFFGKYTGCLRTLCKCWL
jgi:hypothetical protein